MKKYFALIAGTFFFLQGNAQETLPRISVNNFTNKILISWKNGYTLPVATISIQRSYDSLRNYTTIGTVLNPQNEQNGYTDSRPPYSRMYYRVFVAFENGSYLITPPVRPNKSSNTEEVKYAWQLEPGSVDPTLDPGYNPPPGKPAVVYPSRRIFTANDNNVVIYLPGAETKKYTVKFYKDDGNPLFTINDLNEEYLIIEKVNFVRSGWFTFELFENGLLLEKNKFLVPKDGLINNDTPPRR